MLCILQDLWEEVDALEENPVLADHSLLTPCRNLRGVVRLHSLLQEIRAAESVREPISQLNICLRVASSTISTIFLQAMLWLH